MEAVSAAVSDTALDTALAECRLRLVRSQANCFRSAARLRCWLAVAGCLRSPRRSQEAAVERCRLQAEAVERRRSRLAVAVRRTNRSTLVPIVCVICERFLLYKPLSTPNLTPIPQENGIENATARLSDCTARRATDLRRKPII